MGIIKDNTGVRRTHTATHGIDPSLLETEISFWQEMIKFRSATVTNETLERMQQALELAQCKLENFNVSDEAVEHAQDQPAANVYLISTRTNIRNN